MKSISDTAMMDARLSLQSVRATLHRVNTEKDSPICDTIWHTPYETLFDFLDRAIACSPYETPANLRQIYFIRGWDTAKRSEDRSDTAMRWHLQAMVPDPPLSGASDTLRSMHGAAARLGSLRMSHAACVPAEVVNAAQKALAEGVHAIEHGAGADDVAMVLRRLVRAVRTDENSSDKTKAIADLAMSLLRDRGLLGSVTRDAE